jgi:TonB family protein
MRVLLVDHDSESLDAIARAIRGVLELDCVTSKGDALLLLRQNQYDVLIACERAVDGSGLDLLGRTTRTAVPLKRIFAAAPERLQLLGPRLAPFKVQRTINYPIDLEELWLAIAQVTGGPDDETDGTIERVVLDERGIPSEGSVPRSPIPPRPPAPLAALPRSPPQVPSPSANGRFATARVAQPAPEPPLRPPPPPRQPPQLRATAPQVRSPVPPVPADTGRMRAVAPPPNTADTGRMRAVAQPLQPLPEMKMAPMPLSPAPRDVAAWTPEPLGIQQDEFAQLAAQARLGVQQSAFDEAARRKKQRLLLACGAAVVVAGGIVFLIEKFYDPTARAREAAIAQTVQQMAEQQKETDNITLIEIDIEKAIMSNELDVARGELAKLVALKPDHPRREFLQASIDRAAALAKLSPPSAPAAAPESKAPAQAAILSSTSNATRSAQRNRTTERPPERAAAPPAPERNLVARNSHDVPQSNSRSYGAPIGEAPRQATIPLDAPINAAPTTAARRNDNAFVGRTLEAGDAPSMTRAPVAAPASNVGAAASPSMSGTNAVAIPPTSAASPSPAGASAVDVVPAKIVRRVAPVAPTGISRKTAGYVVVKFTITDGGHVADVSVVESTPAGLFDDAAQSAVRKWMYEPRKENGVAVASQAKARLVFDAEH